MYGPVRIEPGMEFHSPLMRFFDHEFQWIIIGRRSFTLDTGKPLAPGLIRRRIKSIGGRTYLDDHRIHPVFLMPVKYPDEICFLTFGIPLPAFGPVNIIHGSDPYTAEFIFGLGLGEIRNK